MGIFFGGLSDEELNQPPADNFVYKQLKRARFRSIELCEGDIITPDYRYGEQYLIRDFQENGHPIVELITREKHDFYNKLYPHEKLYVIQPAIGGEYK